MVRLLAALEDVAGVRQDAINRGNSALVLRAAAETRALLAVFLDRLGIDDAVVVQQLAQLDSLIRGIHSAARESSLIPLALAAAIRGAGDNETAEALDALAASAAANSTARTLEK